ncbi:MAG: PAS domain-containing protein [Rikenellaceae bacterium]|nr:PAS domain-containing protein [Rikenellaceae bacterium]
MNHNIASLKVVRDYCGACHRCIGSCSVKAVRYADGAASIVPDRCIDCGDCYTACPSSIGFTEDYLSRVRSLTGTGRTVVASLSPEWMAFYKDIAPCRMIEALKLLGFTHVSETALGAECMSAPYADAIRKSGTPVISSFCPAANALVAKYYPSYVESLAPVASPAVLHARMLRRIYGPDTAVVCIGACIAIKGAASRGEGVIDASITFDELDEWMRMENVSFDLLPGNDSYRFEPFEARTGLDYVLPGRFMETSSPHGVVPGLETCSVSGVDNIKRLFEAHRDGIAGHPLYIELYACEGGCIHGPGRLRHTGYVDGELTLRRCASERSRRPGNDLPLVVTSAYHEPDPVVCQVNEREIAEVLGDMGVGSYGEAIDCGACGYARCRDFARAVAMGDAVRDMCSLYLRKMSHDRFSALLAHIHSGVFVADRSLAIVEANDVFVQMMGAGAHTAYKSSEGLVGVPLGSIAPLADVVAGMFRSSEELLERDIQVKERMLALTLFRLPGDMICGVVRNLFLSSVGSGEIVSRSKAVINDNLETVQKIAYLLGQTASRTEAVLNSIIESQTSEYER